MTTIIAKSLLKDLESLRPAIVGETKLAVTVDLDHPACKAAGISHRAESQPAGTKITLYEALKRKYRKPINLPTEEQSILSTIDSAPPAQLGDLLAVMLEKIGVDRAAKLYEYITGKSCGCPKRRARLNKLDTAIRERLRKWWG